MVKIAFSTNHQLPPYDIKRRIDVRYEQLKERFSSVLTHHTSSWCPDERTFEASCKLNRLDLNLYGKVEISREQVHVEGEIPSKKFIAYTLHGVVRTAEQFAKQELEHILSKNYKIF